MLRLAIDIDNVVLEWQHHWPTLYQQWFNQHPYDFYDTGWADRMDDSALTGEPLDEWDACIKYTHFETIDSFYEWYTKAAGWETQPYVPGAQGALWEFQKLKQARPADFNYQFVTSRPAHRKWGSSPTLTAIDLAATWTTSVLFADAAQKWQAFGGSKDGCLWLDDAPEVLSSLDSHGCRAIRFEQSWNEGSPASLQAYGWADVLAIVKQELEGTPT